MIAAESLFTDFQRQIYAYIYRRTSDPDTSDDLCSETFSKAAEAIATGKGPRTSISGWLYRIAHNLVIDHYRKRDRNPAVRLDDWPHLALEDADPALSVEFIEQRDKLARAISMLTDSQRKVIYMRYIEGRSFENIADKLDLSEGAVKALKHRAIVNLRTLLHEHN